MRYEGGQLVEAVLIHAKKLEIFLKKLEELLEILSREMLETDLHFSGG